MPARIKVKLLSISGIVFLISHCSVSQKDTHTTVRIFPSYDFVDTPPALWLPLSQKGNGQLFIRFSVYGYSSIAEFHCRLVALKGIVFVNRAILFAFGFIAFVMTCPVHSQTSQIASESVPAVTGLHFADLSGKRYDDTAIAQAKATVFFFSANECPVAAQYAGRMQRFATKYQSQGVRCFIVNSNMANTPAAWTNYIKSRKITLPAVKDTNAALADKLGAQTTPSAVVLDNTGKIRYTGRIDDNADAQSVRRSELTEATEAILAGMPVKVARTRALGCRIWRDSEATIPNATAKVTYAKEVAPILNANCVVCHRAGDVGPFALENYAQARQWASAIKEYTARRVMPPWKPIATQAEWFHDARTLTDSQIETLAIWADSGALAGNLKALPAAPKLHKAGDWPLGKPDLVLAPVRPFHLEAEGRDVYRNFTLPMDFKEDTYLSAMDFQPGNRRIVHHIIAYIDLDGKTCARMDSRESEPGWSVGGGGSGIDNDDWGSAWAPGMAMRLYPKGIALKIPKGAKIVLQVHYHKSGLPEVDNTKVALYRATVPTTQVLHTAEVGTPFIFIPANAKNHKVTASMTIPANVTVYEVLPHMHLLGQEMRVEAALPTGEKRDLIYVKNWEFNWQTAYKYKEPLKLPKGTKITVTSLYDNTAQNPFQPNNPPQPVRFGEQSTDEMCFAFIGFVVDKP